MQRQTIYFVAIGGELKTKFSKLEVLFQIAKLLHPAGWLSSYIV